MSSNPLSPTFICEIAKNVYELRQLSIQEMQKLGGLGCEGLFEVKNDSRFEAKTGGRITLPCTSGFGYVAHGVGARQGEILIAIRGTQITSASDWITDARIGMCRGDSGRMVHIGFQSAWASFSDIIREELRGKNPSHIHCVGHSLGGALAALCADYCASNRIAGVSLYTIGAPRVGGRSFADVLSHQVGVENIYRLANVADPISMLPIYPFFHAPTNTQKQYAVGSKVIPINPFAHMMTQYVRAIGNATSWNALATAVPPLNVDHEVQQWLETVKVGRGVIQMSVNSFEMISKALSYVLKKAQQCTGLAFTGALTALDYLAMLVETGQGLTKEIEEDVKTIMSAILRWAGRAAVVAVKLTLEFIQFVLDVFFQTIQMLAVQAVNRNDEK